MPTSDSEVLSVRLKTDVVKRVRRACDKEHLPISYFLTALIDGYDAGFIKIEQGSVLGPDDELDLSDLLFVQKRLGVKKPQQALDYLTGRALESL